MAHGDIFSETLTKASLVSKHASGAHARIYIYRKLVIMFGEDLLLTAAYRLIDCHSIGATLAEVD